MLTYAKFVAAISGALAVAASVASDGLDAADWVAILSAFVSAFVVYAVPNIPKPPK